MRRPQTLLLFSGKPSIVDRMVLRLADKLFSQLRDVITVEKTDDSRVTIVVRGLNSDIVRRIFEVVREVEEEFNEPLPSRIRMNFEDPETGESEEVEYERRGVIEAHMTYLDPDVREEYDVEIHDYLAEDGTILMVEISGNWVTYFLGEPISLNDVTVYPKGKGEEL